MEKEQIFAIEILSMFEEFLASRNVRISSLDRDDYKAGKGTQKAILFGSDYYALEDEITDIIKRNVHAQ